MKTQKIAIVGTGIAGLRAGLELAKMANVQITFFEKSASVGGRVATRRFGDVAVNHGATQFNGAEYVLKMDPEAQAFASHFTFKDRATDLPKAMRDELLKRNGSVDFRFKTPVTKISHEAQVWTESSDQFDHVLITSPIPQTEVLLGTLLFPKSSYSKKIFFIGQRAGLPVRVEISDKLSETLFESSESGIREAVTAALHQDVSDLELKKWRYSEVSSGVSYDYWEYSPRVTLAGDIFGYHSRHGLTSAWFSGRAAAQSIIKKLKD